VKDIDLEAGQLGDDLRDTLKRPRRSGLDDDVLSFDVAELVEPLPEGLEEVHAGRGPAGDRQVHHRGSFVSVAPRQRATRRGGLG
jgi:hypothetical protein